MLSKGVGEKFHKFFPPLGPWDRTPAVARSTITGTKPATEQDYKDSAAIGKSLQKICEDKSLGEPPGPLDKPRTCWRNSRHASKSFPRTRGHHGTAPNSLSCQPRD